MAATTASAVPRYALEDPTLPKPWKGLIDGDTGYLYFRNPETNVTQYERPTPPSESVVKVPSNPVGSLTQGPSQVRHDYASRDEGKRYGRFDNGAGSRINENVVSRNAPTNHALGSYTLKVREPDAVVDGPAAESYRHRHEITVSGSNVPHPFISFDLTGLPAEILSEVRYLLQRGANVVGCAPICGRLGYM